MSTQFKSQFTRLVTFWLLITTLVKPWRNSVSQDDAAYASQAISWAQGQFQFHPDIMAAIIPQGIVGALGIHVFSFFEPLVVLNLMTWVIGLVLMSLFLVWIRSDIKFILAIFSIPFWIQYGASFLYDIYAVTLLTGLLLLIDPNSKNRNNSPLAVAGVFILSFLLPLELQSLLLVPLLIGTGLMISRTLYLGGGVLLGGVLGYLTYEMLPHGLYQKAAPHFLMHSNRSIWDVIWCFVQLLLGMGYFLIPFSLKPNRWARWMWPMGLAVQLLFVLTLFRLPQYPALAAGVFFSDYLPRLLAIFLISIGTWGWLGCLDLFPRRLKPLHFAAGLSALAIIGAYSLRGVGDIRYMMIVFPLLFFILKPQLKNTEARLGSSTAFFALSFAVSIFLNRYALDTVSARWNAARELEDLGIRSHFISAGYGRDFFVLEKTCTLLAYEKLHKPRFDQPEFKEFVFSKIPRVYNDGWVPQYVIKPYQVFGKVISLKANQVPGQNTEPEKIIPYSSLGISHSLAIYKNSLSVLPWCFRPIAEYGMTH